MSEFKIIGVSRFDFVDKQTNKPVKGVSLHYNCEIDSRNGSGLKGDKFTIRAEYESKALQTTLEGYLNKVVRPQFNQYGNIEVLEIVK